MNKWVSEKLYSNYKQCFKSERLIHKTKSQFQSIEIHETSSHGKILLLDNIVQLTEKDEYIYHEMLVHCALTSHPNAKNILILGGGDGGALKRVLEHPIESVTLVEIDGEVINCCKKYLSSVSANSFVDPRAKIIVADAADFVSKSLDKYDVIITDRGDDTGPGHPLFTQNFYKNCQARLKKNGILITITGVANMQPEVVQNTYKAFVKIFKVVKAYNINVPTYIGGPITIMWGSSTIDPLKISKQKIERRLKKIHTRYTNYETISAAFLHDVEFKKLLKP